MNYGYVRVSTKGQNIDRQYEELLAFGLKKENIFIDRESGKDFNRKEYRRMLCKIKTKDLLVIKSIDRLGRNYRMIIDEWAFITKVKKADIKVLDMPLLDTRTDSNLIGQFIGDIVLQILSFVAENERINIKRRQAEGIRIAKNKGVIFGRPKSALPENTEEILRQYMQKNKDVSQCLAELKISRSTFYKLLKSFSGNALLSKSISDKNSVKAQGQYD